MVSKSSQQPGSVAWARKVNTRWIVHHGLKQSAAGFLSHLEATDRDRLAASCERAQQLASFSEPGEDPKPWFYAGLFSLATASEATQFLKGHWFTAACIPSLTENVGAQMKPDSVGPETESKAERIRAAIDSLGSKHL